MKGIRAVQAIPIPTYAGSDLGVNPAEVGKAGAKVKHLDYFVPVLGKGARMLTGSREENAHEVFELVAAKGGLK
jgi:electron transfer flavoprotein beta subunit